MGLEDSIRNLILGAEDMRGMLGYLASTKKGETVEHLCRYYRAHRFYEEYKGADPAAAHRTACGDLAKYLSRSS